MALLVIVMQTAGLAHRIQHGDAAIPGLIAAMSLSKVGVHLDGLAREASVTGPSSDIFISAATAPSDRSGPAGPSIAASATSSATTSATASVTSSATTSATASVTSSATPSATASVTPSATASVTASATVSPDALAHAHFGHSCVLFDGDALFVGGAVFVASLAPLRASMAAPRSFAGVSPDLAPLRSFLSRAPPRDIRSALT